MGYQPKTIHPILMLSVLGLTCIPLISPIFAQESIDSDFTKFDGNIIQTNPDAQKILERIEESKKILDKMMEKQTLIDEQQKLVDEQRKLSQEILNADLERMNKQYEAYTPRNAFASFVSKLNATHYDIYWDQFDTMDQKITLARAAKQQVLDDGGTFFEAQQAYIKYASMPRIEMIRTIIDLNIKYGFAYADTQEFFDEDGKLPRYDDDLEKICYGCTHHEKTRDSIIDPELNPYLDTEIPLDAAGVPVLFVPLTANKSTSDTSITDVYATIAALEKKMDTLGLEMINEPDFEKQKEIRKDIAEIALLISELYDQTQSNS
jgi:hypothetical protein